MIINRDNIAIILGIALLDVIHINNIELGEIGVSGINGELAPIERDYLCDEDWNHLLDENGNNITEWYYGRQESAVADSRKRAELRKRVLDALARKRAAQKRIRDARERKAGVTPSARYTEIVRLNLNLQDARANRRVLHLSQMS